MKHILKALLAFTVIFGVIFAVEGAAPLKLKKKGNPFKSDLRKIEKIDKKLEVATA